MASVSFKITKSSTFNPSILPTPSQATPPYKEGQLIFVEPSVASDGGKIYLDIHDSRICYTPASSGGGGGEVQPGDHKSFLGISTVEPINGDKPVVDGIGEVTNANSGEWVAVQGSSKEYYWDGREWKPFGDENAEGGQIMWGEDE